MWLVSKHMSELLSGKDSELLDILLKHWVSGPCRPNPTYYTSIQLRIYRATRILGFKKLKSNPRAILGHAKTKGPFLKKMDCQT